MPILFLIVGIFLIVVALNDKMKELGSLAKDDFSLGKGGFVPWIVAIFVIGSLGYAKSFKPVANAFLFLVIIVMLLSNRGFFDSFAKTFKVN